MFSRKRKDFSLESPEKKRQRLTKKIIIIFFVSLLVLGAAVFFVLLEKNNYDLKKLFTGEETTDQTTASSDAGEQPVLPQISGKANFLLICTSDGGSIPRFFVLVHADMDHKNFTTAALPVGTLTSADGHEDALGGQLVYGGPVQAVKAVEQLENIKIDRYVSMKERDFKDAVKELGGVAFNLDRDISYEDADFSLALQKGDQTLTADMITKLMRYPQWSEGKLKQYEIQSRLIANGLDQMINVQNVLKGDDLFYDLINLAESNITVEDYNSSKDCFTVLAGTKNKPKSKTIAVKGSFAKQKGSDVFTISTESKKEIYDNFAIKNG